MPVQGSEKEGRGSQETRAEREQNVWSWGNARLAWMSEFSLNRILFFLYLLFLVVKAVHPSFQG